MKYCLEIFLLNEYENRGLVPNPTDVFFSFETGITKCLIILALYSIILRIIGYFALRLLLRTLEWFKFIDYLIVTYFSWYISFFYFYIVLVKFYLFINSSFKKCKILVYFDLYINSDLKKI